MRYDVCGPFEIPRGANGLVDMSRDSKRGFWEEVEKASAGLSGGCGCYVFGIKPGRGLVPYYVGRTNGNTFKGECFQPHKLNHYNMALASTRGRPMLFMLPKKTPGGAYAKISNGGHPDIDFLELYLIGVALERNSDLFNKRDTKFLRDIVVPGILNANRGRPKKAVKSLRSTLGL